MNGRGIASVHRVTVCALTRIALRLSARLAIPNAHRAAAVRWIALLGALLDTPIREPMLCHFSGRDFDNLGDGGQAMESNTHGGGIIGRPTLPGAVNPAIVKPVGLMRTRIHGNLTLHWILALQSDSAGEESP